MSLNTTGKKTWTNIGHLLKNWGYIYQYLINNINYILTGVLNKCISHKCCVNINYILTGLLNKCISHKCCVNIFLICCLNLHQKCNFIKRLDEMIHGLLREEESHCSFASGNILFEELEGSSKQRSCWSKQWLLPRKGAYNMILQELRLSEREDFRKYLRMNTETFQVNTVRIICNLLSVIYYFLEFWFISFSPPPPQKKIIPNFRDTSHPAYCR